VYKVERAPGQAAVGASEIWFRFPKFVIGYFIAWFIYLAIALFVFIAPVGYLVAWIFHRGLQPPLVSS